MNAVITPLRSVTMIDGGVVWMSEMQARGYAPRTIQAWSENVDRAARWCGADPEHFTREQEEVP